MKDMLKTGFADRQKSAAEAKQALLQKLRPKPTQTDPQHDQRAALRAAELAAVRDERLAAKTAKQQAAAEAALEAIQAQAAADEATLAAKRGDRKDRKALSAAEAKMKRDAKYAARQSRR